MLCLNIPVENSMLECRDLFYVMTKATKYKKGGEKIFKFIMVRKDGRVESYIEVHLLNLVQNFIY